MKNLKIKNTLQQKELLLMLKKFKPRERKLFFRHADKEHINCINELTLNALKGNIPLTQKQKQRLKAYKKTLRLLADRKIGVNRKRKVLSQTGGAFLPFLIPAAISLISSLVNRS